MTGRLTNKQLLAYAERGRSQGWLKNDPIKTQGRRIKPLPKPGGSILESRFEEALKAAGITGWVREHRFCERGWRFDFAFIDEDAEIHVGAHRQNENGSVDTLFETRLVKRNLSIAVEIEGGVHDGAKRGRHIRAQGFMADAKKYGRAAILGWIVLRVTSKDLKDGSAIADLKSALEVRRGSNSQLG